MRACRREGRVWVCRLGPLRRAQSLPLDAVVEVRAELDAAARGQCW